MKSVFSRVFSAFLLFLFFSAARKRPLIFLTFLTFLALLLFLRVPWLCTPSVHPSMYTTRVYTTCHTARAMRVSVERPRAVGLGGFRIGFIEVEYRNVTARFDRQRSITTCVCQAKSLFCYKSVFYSARSKGHLPQSGSFSGPP